MQIKKLSHLQSFNALGMWEFETMKLEDDTLTIRAHRGYPQYFRAEIVFQGVEYIACPINFFDARLRLATPQDTSLVERYGAVVVYCFEGIYPASGEPAETSFIAAGTIEITIYYGSDNPDKILSRIDNGNIHE